MWRPIATTSICRTSLHRCTGKSRKPCRNGWKMRNIINVTLIFACAATASAREEYNRDFNKSVTLGGGKSFRIENSLGNIIIHTHGGNDAAIHATIRCSAETAALAKQCADGIQITVDESTA